MCKKSIDDDRYMILNSLNTVILINLLSESVSDSPALSLNYLTIATSKEFEKTTTEKMRELIAQVIVDRKGKR